MIEKYVFLLFLCDALLCVSLPPGCCSDHAIQRMMLNSIRNPHSRTRSRNGSIHPPCGLRNDRTYKSRSLLVIVTVTTAFAHPAVVKMIKRTCAMVALIAIAVTATMCRGQLGLREWVMGQCVLLAETVELMELPLVYPIWFPHCLRCD